MPPPIRVDAARQIIDFGLTEQDLSPVPVPPEAAPLIDLGLPWPAGAAPEPQPWPDGEIPSPTEALPEAEVLVVTWTVAEHDALADVLTPGFGRNTWARYARNFDDKFRDQIRNGAPSLRAGRLGSYFRTRISGRDVLCFKSELHLNQDGIRTAAGQATLPVKAMFEQLIAEVKPKLVITVGTAGATFPPTGTTEIDGVDCSPHELGDVIVTRGAKFRLQREFANETFAHQSFRCESFSIPMARVDQATQLMAVHSSKLSEPAFGPPHSKYEWPLEGLVEGFKNTPEMKIDGVDMPEFHPILTTDFFEFGTSTNGMEKEGSGVEMGDAVLGLVVDEMLAADQEAPHWLVIRNASDPQINGTLPNRDTAGVPPELRRGLDMQAHWAVWYYETYGYWTSVNSAIAVWAMVA